MREEIAAARWFPSQVQATCRDRDQNQVGSTREVFRGGGMRLRRRGEMDEAVLESIGEPLKLPFSTASRHKAAGAIL